MSDPIPTFRRALTSSVEAYGRFSLTELFRTSAVLQGGFWTAICWLPVGLYALIPSRLMYVLENEVMDPERSGRVMDSAARVIYLLIFPGAPLIGFIAACCLAGGAAGFLDSVKRGLKAVAFLFGALMVLALCAMLFGDEKGPLLAAIVFWIGVAALLAGALGGWSRLGYDKFNPAAPPAAGGDAAAPAFDAPAIAWLEAVARELGAAGLFDHATALRFYKRIAGSGQAAPGAVPPFEAKYAAVRDKLLSDFPGRTEKDWEAANETLRAAALIAAKSPASAQDLLEGEYPGFSGGFYAWVLDCSRKLP